MKELSLRELQLFSLEILCDIHKFCLENDIQYSIAYGTLIGAARHKGFIPWDEDIDIVMTRENYNKFCALYKSDNFELISFEQCNSSYTLFGRVYDTKRTIARTSTPCLRHGKKYGVWVDIFPLDNAPDDYKKYLMEYDILSILYGLSVKSRKVHCFDREGFPLSWRIKSALRYQFNPRLRKSGPRKYLSQMKLTIDTFADDNSKYYSQMCCADTVVGYYLKDRLQTYSTISFEGKDFMCFEDWDYFLRVTFGDYMTPPSKKKMPKSQRSFIRFYWR